MSNDAPPAGVGQASERLTALIQHLEAARESHAALVGAVEQLPAMTVDELAVELGVSRAFAASLARGEDFDVFLARDSASPTRDPGPDWSIVWTDR